MDRSEEKLGVHGPGWKKYDMRLRGKQIVEKRKKKKSVRVPGKEAPVC